MNLIFIHAQPGVGKLTVARELSRLTGYRLFHNHLTVDLLTAVFEFGSEPFRQLREQIWLSVLARAGEEDVPGVIFTFAFEPTVSAGFIDELVDCVESRAGRVCLVELRCAKEEHEERLQHSSRLEYGKLTSLSELHRLQAAGALGTPALPRSNLVIDVTRLEPVQTAGRIMDHYRLDDGSLPAG